MGTEANTSISRQVLIAACLYFGQFSVGYTMGWTAPVLPKLQKLDETPLDRVITDVEASWIVSITFIGIIGGPYISGYLSNVVGRKSCLYLGGGMFVLAHILLAVVKSLVLMYIARVLVGVGNGVLFVSNLVYLGELAFGINCTDCQNQCPFLTLNPTCEGYCVSRCLCGDYQKAVKRSTRVRGTLLTLTGFFTTLGILLMYSVGPYISYAAINWISVVMNAVYLVALFFIVPETAVYQVMKGKREEAMATLRSLGRQDDIEEIVAQANEKPKPKMAQLTELYTVKTNRKAAFIIISLNILAQFSGMMTVIAFVTVIFELTGSNMDAHISTIVIGVTQVFASIIAPVFVDRIGRKILLLASSVACSLSLATLGTYFYLYNSGHPLAEDLQWLSLVSVMVFCIAYYSGIGIIPSTFIGEMFTDTCRSFGGTLTMSIGFVFGFVVSTAFGYFLQSWGPSVLFWIFSGACVIIFLFTIIFVPETKGKSLLEIQAILSR